MPASSRGARWCSEAVMTLLSPLLQLLLVSDDKTTTRCISELLRAMFAVAQRRGNPDLSCLVSCVGEWVAGQLSWQSSKVFAVLTGLCLLHAPLVRAALPSVLAAVADTEQKRGTGVDVKLREMYAKLELRASATPVT
ncbi:uncharacterized protein LOC108683282 [Hyalella azteca]|uniref:Uncharacterized protein LOC108683282 n=1 Tax=Hyalella azteca TaxID=294128 RepID=A0A8B7PPE1_HYAAZ|nr:uncharacterized protein LOC108683282 [Hyalella azteca]